MYFRRFYLTFPPHQTKLRTVPRTTAICIWAELSLDFSRESPCPAHFCVSYAEGIRIPCRAVQPIECCLGQLRFNSDIEPSPAPVRSLHTVSDIYADPLGMVPRLPNHGHTSHIGQPLPPSASLTIAAFAAVGIPYYRGEHPCSHEVLSYFDLLDRSGKMGCPGTICRLTNTSARQHCNSIFILLCKRDNAWASHLGRSYPTVLPDQYRATPARDRRWSISNKI